MNLKFLDRFDAVLIDMDGVLYDSMKLHTLAWQRMMESLGVECSRDEFYLYEGMTGHATINLLFQRAFGREVDAAEAARLYSVKSRIFHEIGPAQPMPGADRMLHAFERAGKRRVLVTGSGQANLLDAISSDYPGAFLPGDRVTAHDVTHGKPNPEPYLKGMQIADTTPQRSLVIENAPLGVRAGKAAGAFTIAVTTGPIPRSEFEREGADLIFDSMPDFADWLEKINNDDSQIFLSQNPDSDIKDILKALHPDKIAIVTDCNVMPLIEKIIPGIFSETDVIVALKAGEENKNLESIEEIWHKMQDSGFTRNSIVINIGGGVVTDIGGFAAATFKRGIRFINLPTTVMGMADAATGGKTGFDFGGLKNEIGAFAQPECVVISPEWLESLPIDEIKSGFAEIVKCALISGDMEWFDELCHLEIESGDISSIVSQCVRAARYKENIVKKDFLEGGLRKILNFGHTYGHALESLALIKGTPIPHGFAVAYGMMRALELSRDKNGFDAAIVERYRVLILERLYPPCPFGEADEQTLQSLMLHDKKRRAKPEPPYILLPLKRNL